MERQDSEAVARPRIAAGLFLIRLGSFIQSLAPVVMKPSDLIEFGRRTYARAGNVQSWGSPEVIKAGLYPEEAKLLEQVPLREGKILLLGVGGGRDAIALAKQGFEVTGVDFVPEMVEMAVRKAEEHSVRIEVVVQEISRLEMPAASFDVVWLSAAMYSSIPTRQKRLELLRRVRRILKPEGYFVCQFYCDRHAGQKFSLYLLKKALAFFILGNFEYENGDRLLFNMEFIHGFYSEGDVRSEFLAAGFEPVFCHFPESFSRGGAVLKAARNTISEVNS